ncbi:MAG: tetratricopeptide repeat protein [Pseudohongiellaceae bacterium]
MIIRQFICVAVLMLFVSPALAQDNAEVEQHRLAAEQGDANSQFSLGLMYRDGTGVPQDYAEAYIWFSLAAVKGVEDTELGIHYLDGTASHLSSSELVAAQQEIARRLAAIARRYQLVAEQGDADAQYDLGRVYYSGKGVPQDYAEAARWYQLAAEQGHADAQENLGSLYYRGQEGVPQDFTEAGRWYRLAAEQDSIFAQYRLGEMYRNGEGVPQDYAEAMRWYQLTIGYPLTQYSLGEMHKGGQGMPQDDVEAYIWFSLSAASGYYSARPERDETGSLLSPAELAAAKQEADRRLNTMLSP